jgi:hypothetical protein
MKVFVLLFAMFILSVFKNYGQDYIYTANGQKIKSTVLEISEQEISYQKNNLKDTSIYIINKLDVVLIKYKNGVSEIFNQNPSDFEPKQNNSFASSKNRKLFDVNYLSKNLLSINALALANGDITLIYDREVLNNKLCLSILGGYNFNSRMGALNLYISDTKEQAKKLFDVGLGINYVAAKVKKAHYYIGLLGKYMPYHYQQVVDTANNQKNYSAAHANQISLMFTNGFLFRISPSFNLKLFCSLGKSINSVPLDKKDKNGEISSYTNYPKVYLGYCFGYRF